MKQRTNNPLLIAVAIAIMGHFCVLAYQSSYNFDIWYMMATGREILEHGIPHENPFAMYDGMQIVVQQWALCVLVYVIHGVAGFQGLAVWTFLLSVVLCFSLFWVARLKKADHFGMEWPLLLAAIAFPAFVPYITMCSSVYSMILFCWVVFFCEKYRKTGRWSWLIPLVPLVVVHMCFHMSFVPFDLVIIACYALPDPFALFHARGKLEGYGCAEAGYARLPLLIALLACALAMLVNPYGLDGALYLVSSYGAAEYGGVIPEMNVFTPVRSGIYGLCAVGMLVLGAIAVGWRGLRRMDLPLTLLLIGTAVLTFQHTRSMWFGAGFACALVAGVMHGWPHQRPFVDRERFRIPKLMASGAIGAAVAVACGLSIWFGLPAFDEVTKSPKYTPSGLLDYMLEDSGVGEEGKQDLRVFNPTVLGGYMEWEGYYVAMDSRVETWNPAISKVDRPIYNDYIDMLYEDWTDQDFAEFLDQGDFDYVIAEAGSTLEDYLKRNAADEGYTSILGTSEYDLWRQDKNSAER